MFTSSKHGRYGRLKINVDTLIFSTHVKAHMIKVSLILLLLCRSLLQSLRHLKCTSFRIQPTQNLFVCWASRSVSPRFSMRMTKKTLHNLCPSAAVNAPLTSHPHGSGIKDRKVRDIFIIINMLCFGKISGSFEVFLDKTWKLKRQFSCTVCIYY